MYKLNALYMPTFERLDIRVIGLACEFKNVHLYINLFIIRKLIKQ